MPFDSNYEPPIVDPVLQRLIEGKARIEIAWCKFTLNAGKAVCARGAIMPKLEDGLEACGWFVADATARNADLFLERALPPGTATYFPYESLVPSYNNHPDTTRADIIALFDRAIEARRQDLAAFVAIA